MATVNVALCPQKAHICPQCERSFVQRCHLLRHVRTQHGGIWKCPRCEATFNREDNFNYHMRNCDYRALGKRYSTSQIGAGAPKRKRADILVSEAQTLEHTTDKFSINLKKQNQTPETIIDIFKQNITNLTSTIERELEKKRALKIVVAVHTTFHQATDPTFLSEPPPVFKSLPMEVLASTDIEEVLQIITEELLKKIDDFEERGSGWVLRELSRLDLHTYVYDPLRASTYSPLPNDLKAKQAVINIQNKVRVFISKYLHLLILSCILLLYIGN